VSRRVIGARASATAAVGQGRLPERGPHRIAAGMLDAKAMPERVRPSSPRGRRGEERGETRAEASRTSLRLLAFEAVPARPLRQLSRRRADRGRSPHAAMQYHIYFIVLS